MFGEHLQPSPPPTIASLYLAFRQAKTALFFERRGVGLLELAEFEQDLQKNLRALQAKLTECSWFDKLNLGEIWIVPKRLRPKDSVDDGVVRIGTVSGRDETRPIDVQLRLSPCPEFAIVEVLYLWKFGGQLEALLSKKDVLGYRLDLRDGQVKPNRRWLFEYWPPKYQEFRTTPLDSALRALGKGDQVLVLSGDLASFYDTVAPNFMLDAAFIEQLQSAWGGAFDAREYQIATASLIAAYGRFHAEASRRAAIKISIGVPIGALTSRLVANLALIPLDQHISKQPGVLCYRRYVDDIVIVAKTERADQDRIDHLREFLPLKESSDEILRLDGALLGRADSEFQLQKSKIRVHHLAGVPGSDFLEAVKSDFQKTVSERRSFVDSATLLSDGVTHLVRAGEAKGSPLRVLRDADRARLERYALSTSLQSLERVSSLVDHEEAKTWIRRSLERVGRVLDGEGNWVDDLNTSLRLLKLAISTGDWESASELNARMDRIWGSVDSLRSVVATLYYRGNKIDPRKATPWTWLRNYLHERRVEAVASSLPIGMNAEQIDSRLPRGIQYKTASLGATALRRRAERLAQADLRARDREEDSQLIGKAQNVKINWLRADLIDDEALSNRMNVIEVFVRLCEELEDYPWFMSPARLFLCTRPPSYFDIARRWLHHVEAKGFKGNPHIFIQLLEVVNAVRGNDYRDPVAKVIDDATVEISLANARAVRSEPSPPRDPRVILGNLVVGSELEWEGAATRVPGFPFGAPVLSVKRLLRVAKILDKAARVARGRDAAVLVLPELSLPRQWFRAVANHVVRQEHFGLVVGLEYYHHKSDPYVFNQVFAVLPGPFSSVATWPWTKRLPSREEALNLSKQPVPLAYPRFTSAVSRTVVKSPLGSFSVLICSELLEARRIADLLGRVNLVLCPAWNRDTSSYDHLIQSVGFQLHSIIAIANNGEFSDCRAWAPRIKRWQRDLCRLIERNDDDVVHVDIPIASLEAFHLGSASDDWRPLPPHWP